MWAATVGVAATGCGLLGPRASGPTEVAMDAAAILARCADRYGTARSLALRGTLFDNRGHPGRELWLSLAIQRPDRFRIEAGGDVCVVIGRDIWSHRASDDAFRHHEAFTSTPAMTAAEMATKGIRLLCVELFWTGPRAFEPLAGRAWWLEKLTFVGRRPCYELVRTVPGRGRLRLWIDQDTYALRRWEVEHQRRGRPVVTVAMVIDDLLFDPRLAADTFRISRAARVRGAAR